MHSDTLYAYTNKIVILVTSIQVYLLIKWIKNSTWHIGWIHKISIWLCSNYQLCLWWL